MLGSDTLKGYTIYSSFPPCVDCTTKIIDRDIKRIVTLPLNVREKGKSYHWVKKWKEIIKTSEALATEAGCSYEYIGLDE